jgi:nitroimidazol reductase NimA-like FMN-containing flavoprotein (pyridoxamine 5'-phosphate oxidase superfamily)
MSVLSEEQCLDLLGAARVGRVIVSIGALPAAFPVNFRVVKRQIVFRTVSGTKLAAAAEHSVVGFEVDEIDLERRTGWSVLVVGMASVVADPVRIEELDRVGIGSWWASGAAAHYVVIEMGQVSGRRLAGSGVAASPAPTAHG